MKKISLLVCVVFLLALAFLVAPVAGEATQIAMNAGNGQSATVGTAVTTLPSVIVTDGSAPVANVEVLFAVASGGGLGAGLSTTTNADGIATVGAWTLGTTAGNNTMTATSGSLTGSPVTFTATGTAGAATQIVVNAGNSQSATVSTAVATSPSVIVKDMFNNPKSGAVVTFAVASGGGSVSVSSITTGADGIATEGSWTLGQTAGTNTLTATSGTLTCTFTATGTSTSSTPTITSITPASGSNTSAVSVTNLAGTGFSSGASVVLSKSGETNITGTSVSVVSATQITCVFGITGKPAGLWNVIVTNTNGQSATLTSGFTITAPTGNGNVSIKSTPSGASAYLNSVYKGITPRVVSDVAPGTYTVLLQKEGYQDWSQSIVVTSGEQTDVNPTLYAKSVTTTAATPIPTLITTSTTTKKTTVKTTATPWPTNTPTPASPVGILTILGAVGLGLIVIRKS
jgi:adhesin/invasin